MRFSNGFISVFPWHSINLIPQFGCIQICEDEYPHERDGSLLEIVLFGYVFHLHIPINLPGMSTKLRGPLWSKSKKKWYRAPK